MGLGTGAMGAGIGALVGHGVGKTGAGALIGGAALSIPGFIGSWIGTSKKAVDKRNESREAYRQFLLDPAPVLRERMEEAKKDIHKIIFSGPERDLLKLVDIEISFIPTMIKWYNKTHETNYLGDILPKPISSNEINTELKEFHEGGVFRINILEMEKGSGEYLSWFPDSEKPYGFRIIDGDYRSLKGALQSYYLGFNNPYIREFSKQIKAKL